MTTRGWSSTELRRAIWLAFGGRSTASPGTTEAARAVGVDPRTLRRWLAGDSAPTPEHAAALRAVLSPGVEVLRRQAMDMAHAKVAAPEIERARPRPASRQWRQMGWQHPHVLWLLHQERLGVVRPMVTRAQPAKPTEVPPGWTLQDRRTFPNRFRAVLAKHELLEAAAHWRVAVRPGLVDDGRHECWLDTARVSLADATSGDQ